MNLGDVFYRDVARVIRQKYKITPRMFYNPSREDPYCQSILIKFDAEDSGTYEDEMEIKIDYSDIGPARISDFLDLFDKAFKDQYPELVL